MNMFKLSVLIPPSGSEGIYVTVHHKTLGRGRLYLTPFDCPSEDDESGPEGSIQFEADNGKSCMFLGLITPCECGRGCGNFAVSDPNLSPQEFLNKLDQLIISAGSPASC